MCAFQVHSPDGSILVIIRKLITRAMSEYMTESEARNNPASTTRHQSP